MSPQKANPKSDRGYFLDDGQTFVVPRPDIPLPLVNVLSTGEYGVAVAQTGAGCSWGRRPGESVTWGSGDFTRDAGGRALYLRDEKSGEVWSAGWQPVRVPPQSYECLHGVGHTLITSRTRDIQSQWLIFTPCEESAEIWRVRIKNLGRRPRTLSLWSAVEWASGRASAGKEASFIHDKNRILLAKGKPSTMGGWGGVFFHAVNAPVKAHITDRRSFWGPYGSAEAPEALKRGRLLAPPRGQEEPFAGFGISLALKPGEERSLIFSVGRAEAQSEALVKARKFQEFAQVDAAWNRTQIFWDRYLSGLEAKTPDTLFNVLVNTWLKVQALSQDLWGGRGSRDPRILLAFDPARVRGEILSRAGGTHPDVSFGDIPWPRLLVDYLRETGEGALLSTLCRGRKTVYQAGLAALKELSSAASAEEDGWIAELLADWTDMIQWAVRRDDLPAREKETARRLKSEAARRRSPATPRRGDLTPRALEEALRRSHAGEAWEIFRALTAAPRGGGGLSLFSMGAERPGVSAAGLFRAAVEGVLGVKPSWDGLRIRPCLPPSWKGAEVRREFRGALYHIRIRRQESLPPLSVNIVLNGKKITGDLLPVQFSRRNEVLVTIGKAGAL